MNTAAVLSKGETAAPVAATAAWFPRAFRMAGWLVLVAMVCFFFAVAMANTTRIGGALETMLYVTSGVALFGGPVWLLAAAVMSLQGLRRSVRGLTSEKWEAGLVLLLWVGYLLASIVLD